jgi:hypothetical protein
MFISYILPTSSKETPILAWASIWKWSCSNPITGYFPGVWTYGQLTSGHIGHTKMSLFENNLCPFVFLLPNCFHLFNLLILIVRTLRLLLNKRVLRSILDVYVNHDKQYLQIYTWAFPYWPGYHPETPILARDYLLHTSDI